MSKQRPFIDIEEDIRDLRSLSTIVCNLEYFEECNDFADICLLLGTTMEEKINKIKNFLA